MARKKFIDVAEQEEDLYALYIDKKAQLDELDKEVKKLSQQIKQDMGNQDLKFVEKNGYKLTRSVSQRITWEEDKLLDKIKSYNMPDLIKQVEQVDVAGLEQYVLDGKIDINDLEDCQKVTDVVSLRISKIKEPTDE